MSATITSHRIKALLLLSSVCFLAAYLFLVKTKEEQTGEYRKAPSELITFQGLPADTQVNATIEMNGKILDLSVNDAAITLDQQQQSDFKLPYKLKAILNYPDGTHRDLSWTVDSRGANYEILADGFNPDDLITLRLNESTGLDKLPFDWSGRIELPIVLEVYKNITSCIDVYETNRKETLSFCHFNSGRVNT